MSARVLEGAEGFDLDGGPRGILLLHGFTANPYGLHAFAGALNDRGFTVHVPLLPGHGTSWEDLERVPWQGWEAEAAKALGRLVERSSAVGVVGLSFGGALALHLAATHAQDVRALILVNPYVWDRRILAAPLVRYVRRTVAGVVDDISKPGGTERGYDRIPIRALAQVARFQARVRGELTRVRQPILAFASGEDHVIPRGNPAKVLRKVASRDKELIVLDRSYHVAWLDHQAQDLFEAAGAFLERTLGPA
jgi:carboxylesterase